MTQGQDPLYPAIPLLAASPLAAFAPQDAEAVGTFGDIRLCWLTLRDCLSFKVFFLQYTT